MTGLCMSECSHESVRRDGDGGRNALHVEASEHFGACVPLAKAFRLKKKKNQTISERRPLQTETLAAAP